MSSALRILLIPAIAIQQYVVILVIDVGSWQLQLSLRPLRLFITHVAFEVTEFSRTLPLFLF